MLILRLTAVALVLAASMGGEAALAVEPAPTNPESIPPIEFYLAKGEANACGPGCSEWIAADGRINAGAAQRLRRLLAKLGHAHPPVFFHSPGGLVTEGLEIGRIIREQKLETSVGHTVPLACAGDKAAGSDKAAQKACDAQKQSGQAIEAAFDPMITMCNSACVYAFAGGGVRLVPPGVRLGIHDVGLDPSAAPQSKAVAAQSKRVAHEHIEEYLHDMGIDEGLYRAALAIPFESKRFIDRDEVVRFGIDKRELGESPWLFVTKPLTLVTKQFFARSDADQGRYVEGFVALNCGMFGDVRLILGRQHTAAVSASDTAFPAISVSLSGQRFDLGIRASTTDYDLRSSSLPLATLALLSGSDATLRLSGTDLARTDDVKGSLPLNMHGFSDALAKLRKSCDVTANYMTTAAAPLMPLPSFETSAPPAPAKTTVAQPAPEPAKAVATADATAQAEQAAHSCERQIPGEPQHMTGRVVGIVPDEEAQKRTQNVEASLGAKVSAAYATLPRVTVQRYPDGNFSTMAAIPANLTVKVGDLVEVNTRYREQSMPCTLVPWTINRLVDQVE